MPRLSGVRERRHQPFYDTLIRTTGDPAVPLQALNLLFGNANVGNLALTNLQVAGQLAADQTYVILALRCWMMFQGTNRYNNYVNVINQLFFQLTLGDKPVFQAQAWYFPAGGGLYSGGPATTGGGEGSLINNGYPSQGAIMKLARPIVIPVRQNISVAAQFFNVGTTNALTLLNTGAPDDQKTVTFEIDGLQTRDVQ
jgi:hypothetical protein